MEKDFKEAVEQSKKAMKKLEESIEEFGDDLNESATEVWGELKKSFSTIGKKLDNASENLSKEGDETTLQAHLGAMEAKENMEKVKESIEEFTIKVADSAQSGLDAAKLKAHLGKMEAEDFWEKNGDELTKEFEKSKESVEKMAVEAIDEIGNFFNTLASKFSEKKS